MITLLLIVLAVIGCLVVMRREAGALAAITVLAVLGTTVPENVSISPSHGKALSAKPLRRRQQLRLQLPIHEGQQPHNISRIIHPPVMLPLKSQVMKNQRMS